MNQFVNFVDIMKPRNTQFGIFKFMTKPWNPQKTMKLDKHHLPNAIKEVVINSVFIDSFLEAESAKSGIPKEDLKKEVIKYLDEMAMEKKFHVIRWMGIMFLKITFMMKIGMFVDEAAVLKLKSSLGKNPVLFLPTHRSYADFCLLTYLCYHYDIEIPAVAAGMDFYHMAVIGQGMRETGAFYIRRTLVGAPLYAATLRHYVRSLVAKYDAPIEFFLEGTRSRSNKSLPPKYGILSMSLVPYFAREVPDITIVPINISYDRLMEQSLFAYEHLGVPKPKETTGGLLKSLHMLNDHYGNIYIKLGDPVSLKEYIGSDERLSSETLKPLELQRLTPDQMKSVQNIAEHVVTLQQKNTVVTITNLVSIVLMGSVMKNEALDLDQVMVEVEWLISVLTSLGATVFVNDIEESLKRILVVHKNIMKVDGKKLRLVPTPPMIVSPDVQKKMKGHVLNSETMANAIPIIQLQLYVNPVLHYLVPSALVYLLALRAGATKEALAVDYYHIRTLLRFEIFTMKQNDETSFNEALDYCVKSGVVREEAGTLAGVRARTGSLLQWTPLPALATTLVCAEVLAEKGACEHKLALKLVQERVEAQNYHPYCLSLEAAANCVQGLALAGALERRRRHQEVTYEAVPEKIEQSINLMRSILPKVNIDIRRNKSIISLNTITSKL